MPRQLAALICILLILYLFWVDRKKNEGVSKAIWIPFIWMVFAASRPLSFWLNYYFHIGYSGSVEEGNPIEQVYNTVLLVAAVVVLVRRRLNWQKWFGKNSWIWLYFIFGALSFVWSDFPFVSFKRWIKALGTVFMALVILTEDRPYVALGIIIRRLAFLLLPLSLLFIKYYPELGRSYHGHSGTQFLTGVSSTKNGLGGICLIISIYFLWYLFFNRKKGMEIGPRLHYSIYLIILPLIVWLLNLANSATSLACTLVAVFLFLISRQSAFIKNPRMILTFAIGCIVLYGILDWFFDVEGTLIAILGRRSDLTTRVPMWEELLSMVRNPIVGFGYESFWLGARRTIIQEHWGPLVQAHNGYLEMYLNMGIIGVFFIICWMISGVLSINRYLTRNYQAATLRLCLVVVVALYNYTEATFYGPSVMWMLFFIGIMNIPGQRALENNQH